MLGTPTIVVLHTVLADPTRHQREVLESVCESAAAVVVMTENARDILMSDLSRHADEGPRHPARSTGAARGVRPPRRTSTKRVLTGG
jgi:hypothetical protein